MADAPHAGAGVPDPRSVLGTRLAREVLDGRAVVRKTAPLHEPVGLTADELCPAVCAYQGRLQSAGVLVPELISVSAITRGGAGGIDIVQAEVGPSSTDHGLVAVGVHTTSAVPSRDDVGEILRALAAAARAGLWLDPHPKNFVRGGLGLVYVDLWPPYDIQAYREARISAEHRDTRDFVARCIGVFRPGVLAVHFIGDVLGMAPDASEWAAQTAEDARELGLVAGEAPVEQLISEARAIRELEDERLRRGLHLV